MRVQNSCGHMCKQCISANYYDNHNFKCVKCSAVFDAKVAHEQRKCKGCSRKNYVIGDLMQETCPGHLYCLPCLNKNISMSVFVCILCRVHTSVKEKALLQSRITSNCRKCYTEKPISKLFNLRCCKLRFCYKCLNGLRSCPLCKTDFENWDLDKIRRNNN